MKKLISLFLVFILCSFFVNAFDEQIIDDLDVLKDSFNSNIDEIPDIVKKLFGNEKINLYIDDKKFNLIIENAKMISIEENLMEKPTMNVYTSEEVIEKLIDNDLTFEDAIREGNIRYESVSFGNKLKMGVAKILMKFF